RPTYWAISFPAGLRRQLDLPAVAQASEVPDQCGPVVELVAHVPSPSPMSAVHVSGRSPERPAAPEPVGLGQDIRPRCPFVTPWPSRYRRRSAALPSSKKMT